MISLTPSLSRSSSLEVVRPEEAHVGDVDGVVSLAGGHSVGHVAEVVVEGPAGDVGHR